MTNLLLLASLALSVQGAPPQAAPYRGDPGELNLAGRVPVERPDTYDGLLIGTVLDPPTPRRLRLNAESELRGTGEFVVQRLRVESSLAYPAGTVVEAYLPFLLRDRMADAHDAWLARPIDPRIAAAAMPVGARVLLLAAKGPQGTLRVPDFHEDDSQYLYTQRFGVDPSGPPAAFASAFFPTGETTLAFGGDPTWRMLGSVAEALRGADGEGAYRIADFLQSVRLPGWKRWRTDDRLSLMFLKAAASASAYHRALIDKALNELRYVGAGDRFYRDLYASAREPDAFPNGVEIPSRTEQPQNFDGTPKDFKHDEPPTVAAWLGFLKGSRSPTVAAWMLPGLDKPAEADVRALARFLDSPDPRLRHAFVRRLSEWYGEAPPEEPRDVRENGVARREYPGLDAAVARWKARLRTP